MKASLLQQEFLLFRESTKSTKTFTKQTYVLPRENKGRYKYCDSTYQLRQCPTYGKTHSGRGQKNHFKWTFRSSNNRHDKRQISRQNNSCWTVNMIQQEECTNVRCQIPYEIGTGRAGNLLPEVHLESYPIMS